MYIMTIHTAPSRYLIPTHSPALCKAIWTLFCKSSFCSSNPGNKDMTSPGIHGISSIFKGK